ncbi:MAG: hypothetical protein IT422_01805 [Pirellulaceae bacterium]|nr:hypothetical protein [Pirellulaceae bacterium]
MQNSPGSYLRLMLLAAYPLLGGCGPALVDMSHPSTDLVEQFAVSLDKQSPSLRERIAEVLADGRQNRILSTEINAAWQIMHGVICYGRQLEVDTPDRGRVSALDYAFSGGQIDGFELMLGSKPLTSTGRVGLKARLEPGSYTGQGHVDQWLAIFAMADLPLDTPVTLGGQTMTLLDWARQAQYDASQNMLDEFSWTLIALTHYFPDEPTWQAADGIVSWELLVEAELTYDLDESPCGGTHRLAGITRALRAKQRLGLADSPVWQKAQGLVDQCLVRAKEQRSADGGISSQYFSRPGVTADLSAELASSGHVFEFIALAASAEELATPWVELAALRLCEILDRTQRLELDCGGLYHALNGLKIYQHRRWPGT